MASIVAQQLPGGLLEMAFTLAMVAGAILIIGGMISMAVYLYRSVQGEGVPDPRESEATPAGDDDDELRKGDADDEWDYY